MIMRMRMRMRMCNPIHEVREIGNLNGARKRLKHGDSHDRKHPSIPF